MKKPRTFSLTISGNDPDHLEPCSLSLRLPKKGDVRLIYGLRLNRSGKIPMSSVDLLTALPSIATVTETMRYT